MISDSSGRDEGGEANGSNWVGKHAVSRTVGAVA